MKRQVILTFSQVTHLQSFVLFADCRSVNEIIKRTREGALELESAKVFERLTLVGNAKQVVQEETKFYKERISTIINSSPSKPTYLRIVLRIYGSV